MPLIQKDGKPKIENCHQNWCRKKKTRLHGHDIGGEWLSVKSISDLKLDQIFCCPPLSVFIVDFRNDVEGSGSKMVKTFNNS